MQWLKRLQENGKSQVYFISACCRARDSLISSIKTSRFYDKISLDLSLIFISNTSGDKCTKISSLLRANHWLTRAFSTRNRFRSSQEAIKFSEYYFWPLIREIRRIGFFLHVNDTFSVVSWSRWSTSQLHERYSLEARMKGQASRQFSDNCHPLPTLDELQTLNR